MYFSSETLAGKHAVVCGASRGIGRACAEAFARAGARLTLLARPSRELEQTLAQLAENGAAHRGLACDLDQLDQVRSVVSAIGPDVDILLCNSSGPRPGRIDEASIDAFEAAFRQHLLAPNLLVQAFAPHMRQQGFGRILNIISTSVKIPIPGLGVSNTVRGAVANWAKTLAHELGPWGITVNNVLPGYTQTERLAQIVETQVAKTRRSRAEVEESLKAEIPARRFAQAQELAYACTFLASEMASYINGINLPVDGGRTGSL